MTNNNKTKIKTPLTMSDTRSNDAALILSTNRKGDNEPTGLTAINWQWNPEEGCFIGECYHYEIAPALSIYGETNNTIEWAAIQDSKVIIYHANYQKIDEIGKYRLKLTNITSVHRAD